MNDVDDVAEDSRGDARGSRATGYTKTKTTTTTITFLVYAPTAVRSARLTTPGCNDSPTQRFACT